MSKKPSGDLYLSLTHREVDVLEHNICLFDITKDTMTMSPLRPNDSSVTTFVPKSLLSNNPWQDTEQC
jgi:hypothetical protein